MARIRSIVPGFRTSQTVTQWPREVRLFWALLWGYLDDHGYGLDDPRIIKADCFPADDDLTPEIISKWLDLIASTVVADFDPPPLCRYAHNGRRFLHATKWAEHQRPQHPAVPKFPLCPMSDTEHFMRVSGDCHETVSGDSHETFTQPVPADGVTAGQGLDSGVSGNSHETLTPEGVVEEVEEKGGVVVARAREPQNRAAATLLGNSLLDEHRRLVKPSLPRDVARRVGESIDSLLDDPEISPDEIREGLKRLRSNRKWGPGMLANLVHEVRQERAGQGAPRARSPSSNRQAADDAMFDAALARARNRDQAQGRRR